MSDYQHITLGIDGMTCNNCALGVKKFLEKKGGQNVDVSFANAEASFDITNETPLTSLVDGIENLGFQVIEEDEVLPETTGWSALEWKLLVCSIFTIPLFLAMFLPIPLLKNTTVQLLLCLPVFIIGVDHFGTSAIKSLKTGIPNMDVLIFIGSTAAFLYSLAGYAFGLGHNFVFWETAATIITLVLAGNVMEHRSVKKTTSAIRELSNLQPARAKLITIDSETGVEKVGEIDVKEIRVGQQLLVNTGDKIPVDGVVTWGKGAANEAMMTGESLLVDKQPEQPVLGGTLLELGSIKIKATKVGKNTALAQIIKLVKQAQANQPPIHKLADKISAIFVPTVITIAFLTFVISYFAFHLPFQKSLLDSIAVLVISCPCAMGLATPTALMVGLGRAAKNGILVKGGTTLETLAKAKNVVFDKTGTLTTGLFSVKKMESELPDYEFKAILMGLEKYSTHPLAQSIVRSLEEKTKPYPLEEVRELRGIGIMGKDAEGNTYMAGSYNIAAEFTKDNSHNVYVLKNGQLIGWVDMEDEIRPDAVQCVDYLKEDKITTILLSGDKEDKTKYMARKLGIKTYHAEKLPKEKLDIIEELNKTGLTVMVGDGINDAPALAKAGIGVSLSSASQVAIESADVVLLNTNLRSLNKAIRISEHTMLTIKQNLFWAFFYNVLAIPIAAIGLLNPMIAALTMALSDIIVIGNSLRLRNKRLH